MDLHTHTHTHLQRFKGREGAGSSFDSIQLLSQPTVFDLCLNILSKGEPPSEIHRWANKDRTQNYGCRLRLPCACPCAWECARFAAFKLKKLERKASLPSGRGDSFLILILHWWELLELRLSFRPIFGCLKKEFYNTLVKRQEIHTKTTKLVQPFASTAMTPRIASLWL